MNLTPTELTLCKISHICAAPLRNILDILSMNFYNYFATKRTLNNTPYRKFSLNCKQHSKTKREHVSIKCLCNKFLTYLYTARIWLKGVQKQPFKDVLQNRCSWKNCKIHRKTPMLESIFNKFAHMLFQSPLKIKQRF